MFDGAWQLVSCIAIDPDGNSTYPLGESPVGKLIYSEGQMSVIVAKNQRVIFETQDLRDIPQQEILSDYPLFEFYCGSYTVSESEHKVFHKVEISKYANQVGSVISRKFELLDNKLTLSTIEHPILNGIKTKIVLIWKR